MPAGRTNRRATNRGRSASALIVVAAMAAAGLADVGYVVAPGENLATIANKYGTTPQAIAQANHLANPSVVLIGTHLRIPTTPQSTPTPSPGPVPAPPPVRIPTMAQVVTYTVKSGDNLTVIAGHFNVTPSALGSVNGITKPNLLRVCQVIRIPVPSPAAVAALLVRYSRLYKLDPALIEGLAWQESGWQQHLISEAGAVGVMQIMPETGRFTGVNILQRSVNTAILEHNVEAGVAFFAYLLQQAKGDQQLAVAGYYQGLRSVRQKGMFAETKRYVANVMALKQRFSL